MIRLRDQHAAAGQQVDTTIVAEVSVRWKAVDQLPARIQLQAHSAIHQTPDVTIPTLAGADDRLAKAPGVQLCPRAIIFADMQAGGHEGVAVGQPLHVDGMPTEAAFFPEDLSLEVA